MTNCKNCDYELSGKYCYNCGQKSSVAELTFKGLIQELWHSITHTDKGILRLIKDLLIKPKTVYTNYFLGQRKKYFSPITFFLLTAGILLVLGTKIFDYEDYKYKMFDEFGRYVLKETRFKVFLLLPLEVLATYLLSYKNFNLSKNIVFWFFLNGLIFTIKIFFTPIYILFIQHKHFLDNLVAITQTVFIFYHLSVLFGYKQWKKILVCFLITNLIWVADYIVSGYLLFGDQIFKQSGAKNFMELLLNSYKL